ncbi:MAG: hypothetical protein EXR79_17585 [Myxococcales bacterium]|nr:hypothetical protein [Myxococcales bacterium]
MTCPFGWLSFWIGTRRYFRTDDDYYVFEPAHREYVVVQRPDGAAAATGDGSDASESTRVFAYPKRSQSEAQSDRDRYDCHVWAAGQSGFDPSVPEDRCDLVPGYRRALAACLEGRGYSVQ